VTEAQVGKGAAITVTALEKSYGATRALDGVSFEVKAGQVHALLGGNGCGKSTAIKILAGVVPADSGRLQINEASLDARAIDPQRARTLGLRFVHQQPPVFGTLTVGENLALGYEYPRGLVGQIRWRDVDRRAREVLDRLGIDLRPEQPASTLGPAGQAMLAVARALQDLDELHRAVLVLDEPTAALPPGEASLLLDAMRKYAAEGLGVLFVTHRLEEVLEVASAATILKDGKVVTVLERSEITHDSLVEGIVGATVDRSRWKVKHPGEEHGSRQTRLSVRGLTGGPVADASFDVGEGEVVGIAGLLGSGRSSLLKMLFGVGFPTAGDVLLDGDRVSFDQAKDAIAAGVAYVPEDRARDALFTNLSVTENISMVATPDYWRFGWLRRRQEQADTVKLMDRFAIRAGGEQVPIASLSGGNQQKVVLARWLRRRLRVLLLDEPTQGVDVGARAEIFTSINQAAGEGCAVLLVSSEFEELTMVCNRILVMHQGRIVTQVRDTSIDVMALERIVLSGGDSEQ
jgi:ribose transport system ATP-binding protein